MKTVANVVGLFLFIVCIVPGLVCFCLGVIGWSLWFWIMAGVGWVNSFLADDDDDDEEKEST